MENNLHQEKVAILSRLIKETSLTLEEALLLLKEEEQPQQVVMPSYPSYPQIFTQRSSGGTLYINSSSNVGIGTTTTTDTVKLNIPSPDTADLNN